MLRFAAVLVLTLAAASASVAHAQEKAETALSAQARYWEERGRYDLARDAWLKLLRATPDDADALAGLANAEAKTGRTAAAQVYLDRLKEVKPGHPEIKRIEAAVRQGAYDPDRLTVPRGLARQGRYDEAIAEYRKIFGQDIPPGRLGLEFYQTMSGAKEGWEPSRRGLEQLAKDNPAEPIYALALAQHLTYREETRREGVSTLADLTQTPSVAAPAKQAWRQGLLWLNTKPADEPFYTAYLGKFGEDPQVAAKLAEVKRTGGSGPKPEDPRVALSRNAYQSLNDGDLPTAADRFQAILDRYPEDADGLGGLGIVRLRQQRFGEARDLLDRAIKKDPRRARNWSEALSTARFFEQVRAAETARKAGRLDEAERRLRAALRADPSRDEPAVKSTLADILVEQGDYDEAESIYRGVLKREPGQISAVRGLIGLLTRSNRIKEAVRFAETLPADVRAEIGGLGPLKGQILRAQAQDLIKARDYARAETALKEALVQDPVSPWTRMDLARLYQRQRRTREANTLVDGLLQSNPRMPEALYTKAVLLGERQDWSEGLQLLEQIPLNLREPYMAELQKRLWVRYESERAGVYSRFGRPEQAAQILRQIEPHVSDDTEQLGAIANGWAEIGDDGRALAYIRRALSKGDPPPLGLRQQYAGLLFKLRQDAEFEVYMEDLLKDTASMTEQQSLDFADLRIGYRLRQADLVREEGDLARSYEYLQPLLRVNPNDPRLQMALARLYNDSKDFDRCYEIYRRVLETDEQNLEAYKGAIGAALALDKTEEAEELLSEAFKLEPQNPRLYALAGRAAKQRGQEGRALELFREALALDEKGYGSGEYGSAAPQLYLLRSEFAPIRAADPGYAPAGASPYPVAPAGASESSPVIRTYQGPAPEAPPPVVPMTRPWRSSALFPSPLEGEAPPHPPLRGDLSLRGRGNQLLRAGLGFASPLEGEAAPKARVRGGFARASRLQPLPRNNHEDRAITPRWPAGAFIKVSTSPNAPPTEKKKKPAETRDATAPKSATPPAEYPPPRKAVSKKSTTAGPPPASSYSAPEAAAEPRVIERIILPVMQQPATPYRSYPAAPAPKRSRLREELLPEMARTPPGKSAIQESRERRDLLKEIAEIQSGRSPYGGLGFTFRNRDGQSGLSQLLDFELPVEYGFPGSEGGRFRLRAVPVFVDAGSVSGSELPLFGAMGLAIAQDPDLAGLSFEQSESGVAIGLAYDMRDLRLDVGTSPIGFPVETILGGVQWTPKFDAWTYKLDLSRRHVIDSLLAYAGSTDPATGSKFGGVTKNGARLDLAYDQGEYGAYVNGSFHVLDGVNMETNSVAELGTGFYIRGMERRDFALTYGVNVTSFFYDKNQRRFTFGHGGYFSPQFYLSVGVPVEVLGTLGRRFSYKLNGAMGIQAFREDAVPFYPGNSGLQSDLGDAAADDTGIETDYPSKTSTGLGYNFGGLFEYWLAPPLVIGGKLALDNARDFNETVVMGFLRYYFAPQTRVNQPPKPVDPHYNFGDPKL